ncbi:MAG TPA: hypothetical protein VHS74_12460 [Solirubrobacterales bacterium]|nr:hypothetical protein [Solirubrobacterales bacterium]
MPTGGEGRIVIQAFNVGDAPTSGASTLTLTLPEHLSVVEAAGVPKLRFYAFGTGNSKNFGPSNCSVSGRQVTCRTEPTQVFVEKTFEEGPFNSPPLNEPPFREIFEGQIREEFTIPPLAPYEWLEVRATVKDEGAAPGASLETEASGGAAATLTRSRPLPVGPEPAGFGVEAYDLVPEAEGGQVDPRAGSHPFQLTTTFNLNQNAEEERNNAFVGAPALPRSLHFQLPPGQLGNVTALPTCSALQFSTLLIGNTNLCPASTVLGVAAVTVYEPVNTGLVTLPVPLFNLEPKLGEPARFGFEVAGSPVILDTSIRSAAGQSLAGGGEPDYGVTVDVSNISQLQNVIASTVTFWGAPADPRHNESRGWGCLAGGHWGASSGQACTPSSETKPAAFLTLPTNCAAPFTSRVEGESWPPEPGLQPFAVTPFEYSLADHSGQPLGLLGCNQLPFAPRLQSEPTTDAATSPTGLSVDLSFEDDGLANAEGLAQSQIKKAVVTLPQGFTTNPSVAEGLHACPQAAYEGSTVDGSVSCPENSKIGDVEIESPLVKPVVHGSLYVARQGENPNANNLLTIYLVARNPEIGVLVKQALKVIPNPVTGQLTTEVDNVPELPFSRFHLSFRQGQRSPLVSPPTCGNYTVAADLYPWSNPSAPVHDESSFKITTGPEGNPCPSGVPPFHPNLEAGTLNNAAGTYSPFVTKITRKDSEQEITRFSIKLPPGVIGKLAGVSECSDAGIAHAKALEVEGGGTIETEHPSCPANSEVGHTLVGSGVGNVLAYAPGKLYLAGPYHGSNISLVSITAAKVGPFDLGTVVVRFALRIDPETAEVFVDSQGSDPIPHIVDGIPIHLRDIRAYVDRPNFTLNPTSCAKKSTASTVLGSGLNFASEADDQPVTVTSPFQAADCASLGFKPKLAVSLKGGTKRGGLPAFKAVLTYPKGSYANIARSVVSLPHSEFLEQAHIGTVCTRVQFKEGKVPGEKCPKASIYGRAEAITPLLSEPLKGPVYLRSSSHTLPDLVAALHNRQVDFDLDGRIDSFKGGIRNTFETVPDAPVSKFVLEMQGGKKGLLTNSTNLCKSKHHAISEFTGQNGKIYDTNPVLTVKCGGKGKKNKRTASHKGGGQK